MPHIFLHPHEIEAKGYSVSTDEEDCLDSPTFRRLVMQGLLVRCRFGTTMLAAIVVQATAQHISIGNQFQPMVETF